MARKRAAGVLWLWPLWSPARGLKCPEIRLQQGREHRSVYSVYSCSSLPLCCSYNFFYFVFIVSPFPWNLYFNLTARNKQGNLALVVNNRLFQTCHGSYFGPLGKSCSLSFWEILYSLFLFFVFWLWPVRGRVGGVMQDTGMWLCPVRVTVREKVPGETCACVCVREQGSTSAADFPSPWTVGPSVRQDAARYRGISTGWI